MNCTSRQEKLKIIQEVVLSTPDIYWDLDHWRAPIKESNHCGTVGCAIGHTIERYPDLGLRLEGSRKMENDYALVYTVIYGYQGIWWRGFKAVAQWLRVPPSLVAVLFNSFYYVEPNKNSLYPDANYIRAHSSYCRLFGKTYHLCSEGDDFYFEMSPSRQNVAKRIQLYLDRNPCLEDIDSSVKSPVTVSFLKKCMKNQNSLQD